MPSPVPQNPGVTPPQAVTQAPSASNPTTAGAVVSTNPPNAVLASATSFKTMADLKSKAPELYKAITESIANEICNEMQQHADRLHQIYLEEKQQNS